LDEFWSQEIVGEANGSLFKVANGIGSTEWHAHDDQDEVFLVTHGTLVVAHRRGAGERGRAVCDPARCRASPACRRRDAVLDRVGSTVTSSATGGKPAWSYGDGKPD
jgi:hypothetical protein